MLWNPPIDYFSLYGTPRKIPALLLPKGYYEADDTSEPVRNASEDHTVRTSTELHPLI